MGKGSPWFSGHFPSEPVLPGIAVLYLAAEMVRRREAEKGRTIRVMGIKRVRFRLPVRPDEPISLSLIADDHNADLSYNFRAVVNGETACTGMITFETLTDDHHPLSV